MRRWCIGLALLALSTTVRAEDAADKPVLVLQTGGHTAAIIKVLFTPDGQQVVTVAEDHTVRRWDYNTGDPLAVLRLPLMGENQGTPRCAALTPDGKTLAVGGDPQQMDGKAVSNVILIDLTIGAVAAVLPSGDKAVLSLAVSHDGKRLAVGDKGGKVRLWDLAMRKQVNVLEGHSDGVHDLAFSPNDKWLASASEDKTARVWDVEKGKEACQPLQHPTAVYCLAWQDDDILVTGGRGQHALHLWDRSGVQRKVFDNLRAKPIELFALSFLPDKDELFYLWTDTRDDAVAKPRSSGGAVLNLKTAASRDGLTWGSHVDVVSAAVSPDGLLAATSGDDDRGVSLWTLKDGMAASRLVGVGETPFGGGWSPDGKSIGWSNVQNSGILPTIPPPRRGGKKGPGAQTPDTGLQRSFDLAELKFGKRPSAKYVRAAHEFGGIRWGGMTGGSNNNQVYHFRTTADRTDLPKITLPGPVRGFTLLSGDRVAMAANGPIGIYNVRTGERLRQLQGPAAIAWDVASSPDGRYLLAAFADQTLRIYDPDKDEPLLSLFAAGSDWIVWTKEGYYAASPGGEKLMGWQINRGPDRLAVFYPAEHFHKALYRPDVIKRVLAEGSVEKARAAADKDSGQATEAIDVVKALPPEVTLLPSAMGDLKTPEMVIKAEAVSKDRPVGTLQLMLDGRPFAGAETKTFPGAKPGGKQTASWKVTLPDGDHHLTVLAESDASLGASPEVAVSYRPPVQEPLPILYVLAVGVNDYPGSLKLKWAVDDASKIVESFKNGGTPKPYGKVETRLLLDKDASKEGILSGLDWLKTKMTADDTAVIFYAGHGHRDKKTSQFYMLPQDVDVSDLDKTGVTGTQIKEKLKAVPGRVLMLLDACHSGAIGQSPADPGSLTDDVQRQLAAPDCGVVVMCAAMAQEEAGEAASVKHGYFTAALLLGLGGAAPRDRKDGLIHLAALDYYVEEEVVELSKDEQHVVVDRPSTVTSFPLVKPPLKSGEK